MKSFFVISSLLISMTGFAAETGGVGLGFGKMPSKCIMHANAQLMDYMYGMDMDGTPGFWFDADGKTSVYDQSKIVKKSLVNGVETITYKSKQFKSWDPKTQKSVFENVEKTISINRDASGKITSIMKPYDTASQFKIMKDNHLTGFPVSKSFETSFSYNGDECSLNQSINTEIKSENGKEEKKVVFDKKFCDQLAPMVKQMGSQNAALCTSLIGQAQSAFDLRNKELQKDGMQFQSFNFMGQNGSEPNYTPNFSITNMIQSCAMADGMMWGYPGMATGVPYGYGMGMMGYGGGIGTPAKSNSNNSAPAPSVR